MYVKGKETHIYWRLRVPQLISKLQVKRDIYTQEETYVCEKRPRKEMLWLLCVPQLIRSAQVYSTDQISERRFSSRTYASLLLCWLCCMDIYRRPSLQSRIPYGVASISRLLEILGLFCKRALWKRPYSSKETCNLKEPTNRSHPIFASLYSPPKSSGKWMVPFIWLSHFFFFWCVFVSLFMYISLFWTATCADLGSLSKVVSHVFV